MAGPPLTGVGDPLALRVEPGFGQCTVVLDGELDALGSPRLLAVVAAAGSGLRRVVLDCTGLRGLDSAGMSTLVQLHRQLQAGGGTLVLRRPTACVDRLLQLVGVAPLLRIER